MSNNSIELNKRNEILEINKKQTEFYNASPDDRIKNVIMQIWANARDPMYSLLWYSGIWSNIVEIQSKWMGDVRNKRVLDFGCFSGNDLSIPLAEKSKYYLAIDLSEVGIDQLRKKIESRNLKNASVKTIDILSPDFAEKDFDVIYAHGVIHHFKHIDIILSALASKVSPDGLVITFDPIQTAITSRIIRTLYHPFRSDKEWEFPFLKSTFRNIENYFEILAIQGFMGYSKWSIPVAPMNKKLAVKLARYLHQKDLEKATAIGAGLWKCLHVAMCWVKKQR